MAMIAAGLPASARDLPAPRPEMLASVQKLAQHACVRETAAALDALGFEPAQITGVSYYVNSASADVGRSVGVDAYVKIQGQSGSVVVQHRQGCSVGGAYASGSVKLPRRL
jgi:hypothetical protein